MSDDDKNKGKPPKIVPLDGFRQAAQDKKLLESIFEEQFSAAQNGDLRSQLWCADYLRDEESKKGGGANYEKAFNFYKQAKENPPK